MTKKWTAKTAAIQTLKDKGVPMSIEGIYEYAVDRLLWRVGGKKPAPITMEVALKQGANDGVFIQTEDLMFGLSAFKAKYKKNILYVLANPAMPDYLKVGITGNLDERIKSLSYPTGIPEPFRRIYAVKTPRASKLERAIQKAHGKHRVGKKEFFKEIDLEHIKAIVEVSLNDKDKIIVDIDEETDVTDETHTSDQSSAGPTRSKKVKKGFAGFGELNIPPGTELTLKGDPSITCQVSKKDPRNKKVRYKGQEMSLSKAAARAKKTRNRYGLPGTEYWKYKGKTIRQIMDKKSS